MEKGKSTGAIHGRRDTSYRSVNFPIYQTSNFGVSHSDEYQKFISDEEEFYIYTRYSNPTIRNAEEKLARLENAERGILFSSGMAAITSTVLAFLSQGDVLVASNRLYGMTYRLFRDILPRFGIRTVFLNESELYQADRQAPEGKMVYFETPINPTTACISIPDVVAAAKRMGALTVIDNTFASPINQNPIEFGVDVVVHSATKYIGGHSDLMAGAVMASAAHVKAIREMLKAFGGCINAIDAFLLDRSLKTLKARVDIQNRSAGELARFLSEHPAVNKVYYPGLESSPGHDVARKQMKGFGGMLLMELKDLPAAKAFCDALQVALNATSLGGVETLVSIPVLTSHIRMSEEELKKADVSEGMVRISVGLEDVEDLIADFGQALKKT